MSYTKMAQVYQQYKFTKKAEAAKFHNLRKAAEYFLNRNLSLHTKRAGYSGSLAELTLHENAARGILRKKLANSQEQRELQSGLQRLAGVYQTAANLLAQRGYNV